MHVNWNANVQDTMVSGTRKRTLTEDEESGEGYHLVLNCSLLLSAV